MGARKAIKRCGISHVVLFRAEGLKCAAGNSMYVAIVHARIEKCIAPCRSMSAKATVTDSGWSSTEHIVRGRGILATPALKRRDKTPCLTDCSLPTPSRISFFASTPILRRPEQIRQLAKKSTKIIPKGPDVIDLSVLIRKIARSLGSG